MVLEVRTVAPTEVPEGAGTGQRLESWGLSFLICVNIKWVCSWKGTSLNCTHVICACFCIYVKLKKQKNHTHKKHLDASSCAKPNMANQFNCPVA